MKNIFFLYVLFSLAVCFCLINCTKIQHLETETPQGNVPSPVSTPEEPNDQISNNSNNQSHQGNIDNRYSMKKTGLYDGTIARFNRAYDLKKKPRIAVFLNRQLSDEVREWEVDSRFVLERSYSETKKISDDTMEQTEKGDVTSFSAQSCADTGKRHSPNELWMWSFEEVFIDIFLQAGVQIIDRATIIRLTAASPENKESMYKSVDIKNIEMDALKGYVDIYIEVLISRSPTSSYGYEFKATAKEVNSGLIICNVTSLKWHLDDRKQREVYASNQGYEIVDKIKIPSVGDIASELSVDLMTNLMKAWGE